MFVVFFLIRQKQVWYTFKKIHHNDDNVIILVIQGKYFSCLEILFTRTMSLSHGTNEWNISVFINCTEFYQLNNVAEMAFTANLTNGIWNLSIPSFNFPPWITKCLERDPLTPSYINDSNAYWGWRKGLSQHLWEDTFSFQPLRTALRIVASLH